MYITEKSVSDEIEGKFACNSSSFTCIPLSIISFFIMPYYYSPGLIYFITYSSVLPFYINLFMYITTLINFFINIKLLSLLVNIRAANYGLISNPKNSAVSENIGFKISPNETFFILFNSSSSISSSDSLSFPYNK